MKVLVNAYRAQNGEAPSGMPEKFTQSSQTVPGMSVPLKILLDRYVIGQNVKTFTPTYDGSGTLPDDIERMEPVERLELARELKAQIQRVQRKPAPVPDPPTPPQPQPNPTPTPTDHPEKNSPPQAQ